MINHCRTLLLNRDGRGYVVGVPGEEYTPPEFRAVALPRALQRVWQCLFGTDPDRPYLHYRVRQYLALLHAGPLAEFVTDLDPRITYDHDSSPFLVDGLFLPQTTRLTGTGELRVLGNPEAPDALGRMAHYFAVSLADADTVVVRQIAPPMLRFTTDLVVSGDRSQRIALPGAGYEFQLSAWTNADTWNVQIYNRPQRDLGEVAAMLATAGADSHLALFGAAPVEPYLSWQRLWTDQAETPLRLGAVVLALAYRIEEARRA